VAADCRRQRLPPNLSKKKNVLLLLNPPTTDDTPATDQVRHQEEPPPEHETVTDGDRAVARAALAECFRLQHPASAPPRCFDDADVEQVAFCAAAIDGDAQSKLQALQDSLTGALRRSKATPPTVRYIWGRIEHFLRHAERGRRIRSAAERQAQASVESPTVARNTSAEPQSALSRAQMAADLAKLFGPTWRARS
jgi:hypothetical protein